MRTLLLVSLVLFGLHLGCKAPSQEPESPNIFQVLELTVAEQKSAIQIAEQAIEQRGLRTTGPLYHVGIQILRDKGGETRKSPKRQAMVTHYRYDGDLSIVTVVDLDHNAVVSVDTTPHAATPLSPKEIAKAKEMALADKRVRRALAEYGEKVEVEALVTRVGSRDDPLFGHRILILLFCVGPNFLGRLLVTVDLTAGQIHLEQEK